jgi:hypothetical protein
MKRGSLAGVGALAFGILAFVAMMIANPPGGNYKVSDVTSFIAKGHRPAIFLSLYLMLLAAAGLLLFLARLRDAIAPGARVSIFWGFSVAATAAWVIGYAIVVSPSIALAFSGGKLTTLSPPVAYTLAEAGWAVMYGAGGLLLGCALVTFVSGPVTVPAWVRWTTAVTAVAALAAIAWFPFFLVYIWAVVLGIWALVAGQEEVPRAVPAESY